MSSIRFGTCSWKYESWKGLVYPEEEGFNYLEEYSKHFNTVEIDQWFWSLFQPSKVVLPNKALVKEYKTSVPENFLFTIKIPNSITLTHYYSSSKNDQLISNPHFLSSNIYNEFINILKPIKNQIGCLIFQFEYLNKQKMNSLAEFQNRFSDFYSNLNNHFLIGIEIRNPNYLSKNFFAFLKDLKIVPVLLEGYYMPPVIETFNKFKEYFTGTIIFRLHGPNRKNIERMSNGIWNQIYIDREGELKGISKIFKELLTKDVDLFINVNNHFEGSAPLTIQKIKDSMKY